MFFSRYINKYLDIALDYGIKECEFWDMTLAEVIRLLESKARVLQIETERKAKFDYMLADLIGVSVARVHNSRNKMPAIEEAYPFIFLTPEKIAEKEQQEAQMFAIQLKQFAQLHNQKLNGGGSNNE